MILEACAPTTEVFFHVGLGKTASTYLQSRFFPKLRNVHYVRTRDYRHYPRLLPAPPAPRLLFSREFDRQFAAEVTAFARQCPQARPIVVLRRHDEWIASQYRRYIKNGWGLRFREFFDVELDQGLWKWADLAMAPRLDLLREVFAHRALVLNFEELRREPLTFLDRLATYMGATYDRGVVCLRPKHRTRGDKALRAVLSMGRVFNPAPPNRGRCLTWLKRRGRMLGCYALLGVGTRMPEAWIPVKQLLPEDDLAAIRARFTGDWERCLAACANTAEAVAAGG